MSNQIFIPTDAAFLEDVRFSLSIQSKLSEVGYVRGLMLVIKNGRQGLEGRARDSQYRHLKQFGKEYGSAPIVTMLSNTPVEQMEFCRDQATAVDHIMLGIEFASALPLGGRKIVTFHLSYFVDEKTFLGTTEEKWAEIFRETIVPALHKIASYANTLGVEVKIETVPVPDWGDLPEEDERKYGGIKLRDLRNPFYLTSVRGFEWVRQCGLGLCLDVCHNSTIFAVASGGDPEKLLFASDRAILKRKSILDDVNELESSDIVHLSDRSGIYSQKARSHFTEGVSLGLGEIAELEQLVESLDERAIPFVLEVNDSDFGVRDETQKSIRYLEALASKRDYMEVTK